MNFDIDPKELNLQGPDGMQLLKLIRRLASAVDDEGGDTPTPSVDNGIFYCTYNVTTAAEIAQAINDGLLPVVKYAGSWYYLYATLTSIHRFFSVDPVAKQLKRVNCSGTFWSSNTVLLQELLTFDYTPTQGSTNPVTSGGVYTALQNVGGGGEPYQQYPEMDGVASPGSSDEYARGDHVHPHDSSKADLSAIPTKVSDLQNDSGFVNQSQAAAAAPVRSVNGQTGDVTVQPATDAQVATAANAWLGENVTQETGYVLDSSLTMSNAAAPADKVGKLNTTVIGMSDWLGYARNLFDYVFTTTHVANWKIEQSGNSVTFTHLSQYQSGEPKTAGLSLSEGEYAFSANYNGGTNLLALYKESNTYVKTLSESDVITIAPNETYYIRIGVIPAQGNSITISNISITAQQISGVIGELNDSVEEINSTVSDLEAGFSDIAVPVIEGLDGVESVNKTISPNGSLITAGVNTYIVKEFTVVGGKTYWITASSNYGNLLWCFYDNNDSVVALGNASAAGSAFTSIEDQQVIAPSGATKVKVTYNTTVKQGQCKTQTGYSLGAAWRNKKWVCVGDSLTAENNKTTKHYFDYVYDATGISVVNMGYSGSGYARLANENHAFYQRISDCPTDADVVTIFGSFNDLGAGLPIGSVDDTGTDTVAGCINTTITNLQTVIPLVNLGIVAPTPWDTTQPATSGQAYNYVEILKAICARRSIPFLDLWRCSNLRPWDANFRAIAYSRDGGSGTHPDENGHKLIAPRFKGFLETLLL